MQPSWEHCLLQKAGIGLAGDSFVWTCLAPCMMCLLQKAGLGLAGGIFLHVDMPSAVHDVLLQKAGLGLAGGRFLSVDMLSVMHDVPSAKMVQGSRAGMKQLAEGSCEVGRYARCRAQGFLYQPGQQTGQARSWHREGLRSAFCTGLAEGRYEISFMLACLLPAW